MERHWWMVRFESWIVHGWGSECRDGCDGEEVIGFAVIDQHGEGGKSMRESLCRRTFE